MLSTREPRISSTTLKTRLKLSNCRAIRGGGCKKLLVPHSPLPIHLTSQQTLHIASVIPSINYYYYLLSIQ